MYTDGDNYYKQFEPINTHNADSKPPEISTTVKVNVLVQFVLAFIGTFTKKKEK